MILNNKLHFPLKETILNEEKSSFDISNPSFTINNGGEKISVKAKRGKFLNNDLILLEDNVVFKSTKFKLLTDKVTFHQKNQTAESRHSSKFESDNTEVISEGFRITNSGDIILFDINIKLEIY
jgi:hypothetical protein